jgi:hypothetical protein
MATMRAIFQAHVDGLTVGSLSESIPITIQWSSTTSPAEFDQIDLVSGNNTLTPPSANVKLWIFVPPAGNGVALTFKGVAGDTGIPMSPFNATVYALSGSLSPFVVNAGGTVAGCKMIWL